MSNDFAHSQRARDARMVKADRLATFLFEAFASVPVDPKERRKVERLAGTRPASDETWDLARTFLDDLLRARGSTP